MSEERIKKNALIKSVHLLVLAYVQTLETLVKGGDDSNTEIFHSVDYWIMYVLKANYH